ncbi:MarR family winged helix-turn-helix transcriptional regulator [Ideonella sp. BN130291]|uniref:MarR family winged helix-turn-helix transcriptional regulator n=1 Tax=Ideonella sp. BN130291 TaxID=3112940 RepID=UPI002E26FDC1|nr:MarR family winged helix-turn-helix transcriptional regulator [Ideonella sp. BN130291]
MTKSVDKVNHARTMLGDDDVLELVHTVMHQYRSLQYQVLRDGPHDITHMESKVLGFFAHHPDATQSDLVAHSGRDKAQLARLIKGLRERGLLEAQADPADRRNLRLALTVQGEAVQRALRQQGQKVRALAVAGLSDKERAQLAALLQRVKHNLDAHD